MRLDSRWWCVLLIACAACKRGGGGPDAGLVSDAGPARADLAPVDGGVAAAPIEAPPRVVPSSASTVSFLRELADGGCSFVRADPVASLERELVALAEPCIGARVAWPENPAAAGSALVWFDPGASGGSGLPGAAYPSELPDAGEPSGRIYALSLASGSATALPPAPDAGEVQEVVFHQGLPTLLLLQPVKGRAKTVGSVKIDGVEHTFDPQAEGLPALAHAYHLQDGGWRRFETKATDEGTDNSLGIIALDASRGLSARTGGPLAPRVQGDSVEDEKTLAKLESFKPADEEGGWTFFGASEPEGEEGRIYIWEAVLEFAFTMGRIVLPARAADGGHSLVLAPELGFSEADFVAARTRGPFLLVSEALSGRHPRLYDVRTGTLVWKADDVRAATFWPGTYEEPRRRPD